MKRFQKFILASLIVFIFSTPFKVMADTIGTIIGSEVRVRSTPDTSISTNKIGVLNTGNTVYLVDTTKYTSVGGTDCSVGWYKLNYNDSTAYVCSKYIVISTGEESDWTSRINNTNADIYTDYSFDSISLKKLPYLADVTILDQTSTTGVGGCPTIWYTVKYGNITGYVCGRNITFKSDMVLKDTAYEDAFLKTSGFPETYWPYLSYLHSKHPSWTFKPSIININWNNVVNGERDKNKIQNSNPNYILYPYPTEGTSWYTTNDAVNAFYLDPRNFLQERYIFMFEDGKYVDNLSSKYYDIVKALFGSSYLSNDTYVNWFLEAGTNMEKKVAPSHLAARSVQEGCSKETYDSITGYNPDRIYRGYALNGFYNYYNVGAYQDDYTSNSITRGLAYAAGYTDGGTSYGRPWDTREKAIKGGALFLAEKYVYASQNTLYYQKFNTYNGSYTHQYMSNVDAPRSESDKIYNAYSASGVLDNNFSFDIPVYLQMPYSTSLPSGASSNNYLSGITIGGNALNSFDKDVIEYVYFVSNLTDTTTISVATEDSKSTVNIIGAINGTASLTSENTKMYIDVTAENGTIKTYSIEIRKVEDTTLLSEIMKKISYKNDNDYIFGISKGGTTSSIINNILSNSPTSTLTFKSSSGELLTNNSKLATGQMLTIQTTLNETKTYDIVITGDVNGDGEVTILDLLKVQKHILKAATLSDSYLKAGDTNFDNEVSILDLLRVQKSILGELNL